MKRKIRLIVALAGIAAASFGSQAAFAHQEGEKPNCQERHDMHRKGGHFRETMKKLGLTEQQKAQVREQFESSKSQVHPMFKALMTEKQKLHALIGSGSADEQAIRTQSANVARIQADLAVQRAQQTRRFLSILTPEQAAKYREIQAERQERMKNFLTDKERGGKHGHRDHFDPLDE